MKLSGLPVIREEIKEIIKAKNNKTAHSRTIKESFIGS